MKIQDPQPIQISKKKPFYTINNELKKYLIAHDRYYHSSIIYEDLLRYNDSFPIYDKKGTDTLWANVLFSSIEMEEIHLGLKKIYMRLKSDGNKKSITNFVIDSIDFCKFGNTHPFRIKIKNLFNDNHDYFYIKKADASRVYGLELEQILSPNHINFIVYENTLVEEHIIGIPGDDFIKNYFNASLDNIRLAKEFVKFNERCFMRLLGDQRAYNFVVVATPDFDKMQYRIRSIDFDQQSYEGNLTMYKPQFFKENYPLVKLSLDVLNNKSIKQYQAEERALLAKRILAQKHRLNNLMEIMQKDTLSNPEKINQLKGEIYAYLKDIQLKKCKTMGDIIKVSLNFILRNYQSAILYSDNE